jgi:hypothetical protein
MTLHEAFLVQGHLLPVNGMLARCNSLDTTHLLLQRLQ